MWRLRACLWAPHRLPYPSGRAYLPTYLPMPSPTSAVTATLSTWPSLRHPPLPELATSAQTQIKALLKEFTAEADPAARQTLCWEVLREACVHSAKEEMVLYPAMAGRERRLPAFLPALAGAPARHGGPRSMSGSWLGFICSGIPITCVCSTMQLHHLRISASAS